MMTAIVNLQTLLNTYRDSKYQMQPAKLVGMIRLLVRGGLARPRWTSDRDLLRKDFITFYHNAPEAAQAQLRVGDIYFREMDKPDRDYTKAEGAEENYRLMLQQFPNASPELRAQATQKLRDVQEVLAERDADIGAFYSSHQSWPAAIARLQTVVDLYPEYSRMDAVRRALSDARAAMPQAGADTDAINVSWVQLQELNPDVPPSQQKSAVLLLDGKTISIPGFMVPLQDGVTSVNEFLLIPYRGASIHVPPPPPNQMVYVKMDADASLPVTTDPILVTGPFKISTVISPYGDLSYTMTGMTVKPYTSPQAMAPQNQLNGTYKKWVDEDVHWIISDQEMAEFRRLSNDDERDQFIQNFWQRRNPTPASTVNPYREEYYQRIAYANQRYAYRSVPGWKTDRGQIYIKFGKPDTVDSHSAEGQDAHPAQEGGGTTATYPFEVWHYRSLAGIGDNIDIEFVDMCRCGEYHATVDRSEKNALKQSKESDRLETFAKLWAPASQAAASTQLQPNQAPIPGHPDVHAGPEILSDAQGVDFSAYMRRLHDDIERNWYPLIPEEVQAPPTSAKGITGIRFKILPSGDISGILLETPSGNTALDKAAWSAIVSQGKFQPLPKEFHGPSIELRCGFYYNIEPPQAAVAPVPGQVRTVAVAYSPQAAAAAAVAAQARRIEGLAYDVIRSSDPRYPPIAKAAHVEGPVVLRGKLSVDGRMTDLQVVGGPEMLQSAAIDAMKAWKMSRTGPAGGEQTVGVLAKSDWPLDLRITVMFDLEDSAAARPQSNGPVILLLSPQQAAQSDAELRLPQLYSQHEAMVAANKQTTIVHLDSGTIAKMKIGGSVPVYPRDARQAHIQGAVVVHVVISPEGKITNPQVMNGPEELRQASLDAVRTWTYQPYLLDGRPVAVEATITVNFTMEG